MQRLRAFRTVGACLLQPVNGAPRRAKMAHVTYSTAFSSDSCPRLYSSAFFAGPESWYLISANASCNVRAIAATLLSLRSLLSRSLATSDTGALVASVAFVAALWLALRLLSFGIPLVREDRSCA